MTKAKIFAALVKAQKGFAPALKTSTNPHFRSKYADLAACVEAVIDSLNENGIFLSQPVRESDGGVTVETVFLHESGEQFSAGMVYVPASKRDAHGYGSALTYARRYGLMSACGIAPEDDDGNHATRSSKKAPVTLDAGVAKSIKDGAQNGTQALQDAFKAAGKAPGLAEWWAAHGDDLKAVAAQADQPEQANAAGQ